MTKNNKVELAKLLLREQVETELNNTNKKNEIRQKINLIKAKIIAKKEVKNNV